MRWYHILSTLNLHARPRKIQKYHFLSMGPPEHPKWRGAICSNTGTPKVPFSAEIPLVNPSLTKGQTRSKSTQNNMFHGLISNPSSSKGIPKPKKKRLFWVLLFAWMFSTHFSSLSKKHTKNTSKPLDSSFFTKNTKYCSYTQSSSHWFYTLDLGFKVVDIAF